MFPFILLIVSFLPQQVFADTNIIINEVVVHPGAEMHEWIEVYSPEGKTIDGYWIDDDTSFTDDSGSSGKKEITASVKGSNPNYIVFTLPSALFNNSSDTVALFDSQGNLLDSFVYDEDPGENVAIGRYPDGSGEFQVLASTSPNEANSGPKPTETPTPAPTAKPVKTPTTAKVAKSTSSNNGDTTVSDTEETLGLQTTIAKAKQSITKVATNGAVPTAILRRKKNASAKEIPQPTATVLVKDIATSPLASGIIIMGGLLTLTCGILLIRKKLKESNL